MKKPADIGTSRRCPHGMEPNFVRWLTCTMQFDTSRGKSEGEIHILQDKTVNSGSKSVLLRTEVNRNIIPAPTGLC